MKEFIHFGLAIIGMMLPMLIAACLWFLLQRWMPVGFVDHTVVNEPWGSVIIACIAIEVGIIWYLTSIGYNASIL